VRIHNIIIFALFAFCLLLPAGRESWAQQEQQKETGKSCGKTEQKQSDKKQTAQSPSEKELNAADPQEVLESAKQQMRFLGYGEVPDDALAPYRPLLRPFANEPKCRAGKICEKIKKEETDKAEINERRSPGR
jgi:hypothetical protein